MSRTKKTLSEEVVTAEMAPLDPVEVSAEMISPQSEAPVVENMQTAVAAYSPLPINFPAPKAKYELENGLVREDF